MAKTNPIFSDFTRGELSPNLYGRVDLEQVYYKGCKQLENFYVFPQGGVTKRPGTKYIGTAKYADKETRLIPFEATSGDRFILEFGHYYIRFFLTSGTTDGLVSTGDGVTPYEVKTPYNEIDVTELKYTQSGDAMFIVHEDHPPKQLLFYDYTDWRFSSISLYGGPFMDSNVTEVELAIADARNNTRFPTNAGGLATTVSPPAIETNYEFAGTTTQEIYTYNSIDNDFSTWYDVSDPGGTVLADGPRAMTLTGDGTDYAAAEQYLDDYTDDYDWTVTFEVSGSGKLHFYASYAPSGAAPFVYSRPLDTGEYAYSMSPTGAFFIGFDNPSAAGVSVVDCYVHAEVFHPDHVGSLWKLEGVDEETLDADGANKWTDAIKSNIGDTIIVTIDGTWAGTVTVQKKYQGTNTWFDYTQQLSSTSTNETLSITNDADGAKYRVGIKSGDYTSGTAEITLKKPNQDGYLEITSVPTTGSNTSFIAYGRIEKEIPLYDDTPTENWSEGAFSNYRGYPKAITFYENRLVFAGTDNQPETVWGSVSNDYSNFENLSNDDDESYNFTIVAHRPSDIQWLIGQRVMLIGTETSEWKFGFIDEPTTPTTVDTRIQTTWGSEDIQALSVGHTVIFVEKGGTKVREIKYQLENDGYLANDISVLSDHLFSAGIKEMHYTNQPDSKLFFTMDDGSLIVSTYDPSYQNVGFYKYVTDGLFTSTAVVETEGEDEVWFVVQRSIGGVVYQYIEQLQTPNWTSLTDAWYLDCAMSTTTLSGTGSVGVSGLGHLEGETVYVNADGSNAGSYQVANGQISLNQSATDVIVGLPYTAKMETMDIEAGARWGVAQGKPRSIYDVVVRVKDTVGLKYGYDEDNQKDVIWREYGISQVPGDQWVTARTDDIRFSYDKGVDRKDITIYISHDYPLPCTILAIIPMIWTSDM